MKKILITIAPFCIAVFVFMWILCGLEVAFAFFSALLLSVAFVFGGFKWAEFVDKHIKD